jgi:hypothetical protein
MPYTYQQSTGQMADDSGKLLTTGYSGAGLGRNNPALQHVHNFGPLPQGIYRVTGPECTGPFPCAQCGGTTAHHHGPFVLRLHPTAPLENPVYTQEQQAIADRLKADGDPLWWMFGRAGFLNHGDNATGTASEGCMITGRMYREQVSPNAADPNPTVKVVVN